MNRIPRKRLVTLVAALASATACSSSDAAPARADRQPQTAPAAAAAAPVTTAAAKATTPAPAPAPAVKEEAPAHTSRPSEKSSEAAAPRVIQASDLANDVCDLDCQNTTVDGF